MSSLRPLHLLAAAALIIPSGLRAETDPQVAAAVAAVYPSIVRIHVVSEEGRGGRMQKGRSSGSGAIISKEGHILTNHHVAGRATRITVRLADRQEVRATLVGTDALSDLAVLQIDRSQLRDPNTPLPIANFGDSSKLRVGDVVLAMGSPAGVSQSVTKGIVANTEMISPGGSMRLDGESVGELVRWIGHDAVIYPGNSGGPLVNLAGEIIGVNEVGIGSLGGAIPSNLARKVADELIAHGHVRRSWTGIEPQPLLKEMKTLQGILVGGVIEDSPAAKAGIRAADILQKCNGIEIPTARAPEDVPLFNRMILETPVGSPLVLEGLRGDQPMRWEFQTAEREPAEPREIELLSWGMTARDLTELGAKERLRENNDAVVVQSLRPGGPAASAKPALTPDSLILSVNGEATPDVASLVEVTKRVTKGARDPVPTLVSFERDGMQILTVVEVGPEPEPDRPGVVRKAWLGVDTQVISAELAKALGMEGTKGVRVTRVHPDTTAAAAGFRIGDLILKLDGEVISASRPEDSELFATQLRQYRVGTEVTLTVRRGKDEIAMKVALERGHEQTADLASHECEALEFTARDLGQEDRVSRKLGEDFRGVLVTAVAPAGWAALGGLSVGDIILAIDGKETGNIEQLKSMLAGIEETRRSPVGLFVRRGIVTRFVELEPAW